MNIKNRILLIKKGRSNIKQNCKAFAFRSQILNLVARTNIKFLENAFYVYYKVGPGREILRKTRLGFSFNKLLYFIKQNFYYYFMRRVVNKKEGSYLSPDSRFLLDTFLMIMYFKFCSEEGIGQMNFILTRQQVN